MRTRLLLAAVAAGLLLGADQAKKDDRDVVKLLGSWKLVETEINGKREKVKEDATMTLAKEKMTFKVGGHTDEALYKVDPTTKPKQFDLTFTGKPDPERKGTALGIYELDGDRLTICGNAIGSEGRPKELKTKEKDGLTLEIYERVKPK